jgi:1,4-dihydroxy-2-naphthoyl-CoA synthase
MAKVKDVKSSPVKITLADGVERELRFTLNAMAELEDRYGSVEKAFDALEQNSIKALRCVLWAGLLSDDPELTEQQVGGMIDLQYMTEIMEVLGSAFEKQMPEAKPEVVTEGVVKEADPKG